MRLFWIGRRHLTAEQRLSGMAGDRDEGSDDAAVVALDPHVVDLTEETASGASGAKRVKPD